MKILVTGGAGFIGSNLISILQKNGYHAICFDNFDEFKEQKQLNISPFLDSENFTLIEGDICNMDHLKSIPDIDVIVHLAAKTNVRSSINNARRFYEVNVSGTKNLLEFARLRRVKQFVFASSSSVYGINPAIPWTEDAFPLPVSPYAISKLRCEEIGRFYSDQYGIRFLALRFFNVFGPAQRPDLVIHKFFKYILEGRPLEVLGDGRSSRDYTFVGDIVDGILSAIGYDQSDFEVINLGAQRSVNLMDLIIAIEEICQSPATINHCPEQPGDLLITYASIGKAKKILNYVPQNIFKEGLTAFYSWFISVKENRFTLPDPAILDIHSNILRDDIS
ncbi:NAD-dependent epimerase/dehydratase family protein [Mucilaginibacter sp. SJ]|uniref:NAD-dependent epimerase/dehydratase family protein n=1 Tax=Mucilaginibacter sp. SJ TaxID=3029053 RepID=UPI0023A98D11|nr:NAD-dependent epimerase/dehydratase family protein [Mucilaginibacter sp. SJ]WEA01629.1 GDP-mannose 4,6-dehydratase [Mucilaginibacter sp. SJ]